MATTPDTISRAVEAKLRAMLGGDDPDRGFTDWRTVVNVTVQTLGERNLIGTTPDTVCEHPFAYPLSAANPHLLTPTQREIRETLPDAWGCPDCGAIVNTAGQRIRPPLVEKTRGVWVRPHDK